MSVKRAVCTLIGLFFSICSFNSGDSTSPISRPALQECRPVYVADHMMAEHSDHVPTQLTQRVPLLKHLWCDFLNGTAGNPVHCWNGTGNFQSDVIVMLRASSLISETQYDLLNWPCCCKKVLWQALMGASNPHAGRTASSRFLRAQRRGIETWVCVFLNTWSMMLFVFIPLQALNFRGISRAWLHEAQKVSFQISYISSPGVVNCFQTVSSCWVCVPLVFDRHCVITGKGVALCTCVVICGRKTFKLGGFVLQIVKK